MKNLNKKRAVKVALSTAVAASAFVATSNVNEAEASSNVNELVEGAVSAGTVLKWAISLEGSGDFKTRPYVEYNNAKKAIKLAEDAFSNLSYNEKLASQVKLLDAKTQVQRAQAYIDAITSSEKIKELNDTLDKEIASGDLARIEKAYHSASFEYKKQAKLLDRVYGQSTRDGIRNSVKPTIEKSINSVIYDVTVKIHLDKAKVFYDKGENDKAIAEIEKANYNLNLKGATFKFKKELEKTYNDVLVAIPTTVTKVEADGNTKIVLSLNKAYELDNKTLPTISASSFKINNLVVTGAKLSDDKKSIVLTTSVQEKEKDYVLTFNGKTYNFKSLKGEIKANIKFDKTSNSFLEATDSNVYSSKLTNLDGTPYTGSVTVKLTNNKVGTSNAVINSVNGKLTNGVSTWTGTPDSNGNLVFSISANKTVSKDTASVLNVVPEISFNDGDNKVISYAPTTHFMKLQSSNATAELKIENFHIDTASDFVYANGLKWKWDTNDLFFLRGEVVTQAEFEKSLSNGDLVSVSYSSDSKNVSTWNILTDGKYHAELTITNPLTNGITSNLSNYELLGKGQAGNMIRLYRNGIFVGNTYIDIDGDWSYKTNLLKDVANTFTAYQYAPGTDGIDGANSLNNATTSIFAGDFTSENIKLVDKTSDGITLNDELVFSFTNDNKGFNHTFKDGGKGTITLSDGLGKRATLNVIEVKDNKNSKIVKVTDFVSIEEGFNNKSVVLPVISVEGLVNQDGLVFDIIKSTDKSINVDVPVDVVATTQALIDSLPTTVTNDTLVEVSTKLTSVKREVANLTVEQQTKLNITKITNLDKALVDLDFANLQILVDNLPATVTAETLADAKVQLERVTYEVNKLTDEKKALLNNLSNITVLEEAIANFVA